MPECVELWSQVRKRRKRDEIEREIKLAETYMIASGIVWAKETDAKKLWSDYHKKKIKELKQYDS